ncbi:hypothetical protein HCA78_05825 [Listeria booriae]|uniref:Uncharacterized protein n=1 Tax=Listeria booriae TaxID=1552123 RepID=A0A842CLX6_9LIST|nr:hypothetical protein [Listeria booriae]MBC2003281.1 hypothetical protein [Listeria booriae]
MEKFITEAIDRIYIKKEYDFFRERCKSKLTFLDEFISLIESQNVSFTIQDLDSEPAVRLYIKYPKFEKGELKIIYKTIIDISKIVPIYYVQHEFEVDNIDEMRMSPVLDGFDGQPYTIGQADLYDRTVEFMNNNGYVEVSYTEMNIVIPYIEMPKDVSIFGPQFTVEICLFNDILNICEVPE